MSVDLNAALDDYAAAIATATGYTVVRDPDLIHPPVVYIDLPEIIAPTLGTFGVEIPLYVIGGFAGAQAGSVLLGMLPAVMDATGVALAVPQTLTVGGTDFQTYKLTIPATIQESAA